MTLASLHQRSEARAVVDSIWPLLESLYPICRSITGNGVTQTLDQVESYIPLLRTELSTGTAIFDWEIPKEWNIRDAYIAKPDGTRVVDFNDHNLHVVSYSVPVRQQMSLAELQPHLYSLPEHPDWIPYRTSYYREHWGFCMRHRDREVLSPGPYDVVIDATLSPGRLVYAEHKLQGRCDDEAIIYTHVCHPSLANDNLTGIAAAVALAQSMRDTKPQLSWRFVFAPGTIGSLAWLAMNEARLGRLKAGLVIGLLGDKGQLTYKRSRRGNSETDRALALVLGESTLPTRTVDFEPYGYDERQFCSPGFNLPIGRLTRSPNGDYAEYHTSADNLAIIGRDQLAESISILARAITVIDENGYPVNQLPKGEPRLGKRGLYGSLGGSNPTELEHALLWVLNQADGHNDLIGIAQASRLAFGSIRHAASKLEAAGLIKFVSNINGTGLQK